MKTFILIAQNCDGYEPVGEVTESEAPDFVASDMASRNHDDFCPESYALWERGRDGRFVVHSIIPAP